jgi:three-Cys-motif partner protein
MSVDANWIRENLSELMEHADDLADAGDTTDNPKYGPWTALKLMVFSTAVEVYTKVANGRYDYYYVDALSGSGIVEIDEHDANLVGSPILAGTVPRYPFEKMFLIEQDDDRAEALENRLNYAADNIDAFELEQDQFEVIPEDANEVLPTIRERVVDERGCQPYRKIDGKTAHHFAFIDNERMEVKFDAIRGLLTNDDLYGDQLINYQEVGINRKNGRLESDKVGDDDWETLLKFFDTPDVRGMDAEGRIQLYFSKLDSIGQQQHRDVFVRGSDSYPYGYRMIYAAGGSADFIEFMDNYGAKIEKLSGDDVGRVIDTMEGRLGALDMLEGGTGLGGRW